MAKTLAVGVHEGDGPEPGYRWNVVILRAAFEEAMRDFTADEYHHLAEQVKELAREVDPTHSVTASIDAVEDFHELRDKGGILRGKNSRVFFFMEKAKRSIVVLGTFVKNNDGATPQAVKIRIKRRKRLYLEGELGVAALRPSGKGEGEVKAKDGDDR